ncbi:MAG: hypothetical protein Q9219_007669 [cf. Caloplaca sp. 3 TL-2023]
MLPCWVSSLASTLMVNQEAQTAKIDLPDDDPNSVACMLKYIYTAKYEEVDPTGTQDEVEENHNPEAMKDGNATSDDRTAVSPRMPPAAPGSVAMSATGSDDGSADGLPKAKFSAIRNNVLICALADKYDVQPLKTLSQRKFREQSLDEWEEDDIVTILTEVYATTSATDRGLRDMMLNVCTRYIDRLMESSAFHRMLCDNATLAFEVVKMLHNTKEVLDNRLLDAEVQYKNIEKTENRGTIQSLQDQLKSVRDRMKLVQDQLKDEETESEWKSKELKAYQNELSRRSCRHCGSKSKASTERLGGSSRMGYVELQCTSCKKRL